MQKTSLEWAITCPRFPSFHPVEPPYPAAPILWQHRPRPITPSRHNHSRHGLGIFFCDILSFFVGSLATFYRPRCLRTSTLFGIAFLSTRIVRYINMPSLPPSVLLFLFGVGILPTQTCVGQQDSLKTVFHNTTQINHKVDLAIALSTHYQGQPDSSVFYAREALALSKKTANNALIGKSMKTMGKALTWQNHAKEGALYLDSALQIARVSRDSAALADVLYDIGKTYYYIADYSKAVTHFQQTLRELGPYMGKIKWEDIHAIYEALGVCLKKTGQYNAALDAYQKALAVAVGPSVERGRTLFNIKNIFIVKGDYHTALTYTLEAVKVFEQLNNQLGIAIATSGVSDIYLALGNYEPAIRYQRDILKMYHTGSISDIGLKGITFTNLGFCFLNLPKHLDSASYYLNQAADIFIKNGNQASLSEVYSLQGEVYLKNGDFSMAEKKYHEAQRIAQKIDYEALYCSNSLLLAKVYFHTGTHQKALPLFHKILSCAEALEQRKNIMEAHQYLAEIYEKTKKYDAALQHSKIYHALKDSTIGRQTIFEVADLEKKVAMEKQLAEENKLALEVEKTKNKLNRAWVAAGIGSSVLLLLIGALLYRLFLQERKNVKNLQLYIEQLTKTKNKLAPLLATQMSETMPNMDMESIPHAYIQEKINELDLYIEKLVQANPEQKTLNHQHQVLQTNKKTIEELKTLNYSISHDLMTPISRIQHIARDLQKHLDKNKIGVENSQKLTSITLAASQSGKMLLQLLEFSKLEQEIFSVATFNSLDLVRDIIKELSFMTNHQQIAIIIDNTLPTVCADVFAIRRVFTNLLQNAIKYGQDAHNPEIHISATVQDGLATFYVQDNGPGFNASEKEKIFKPFYRATPYQTIGNGMGLAISKRIVEKHGGSIWAHSAPNEGATFVFTIPIKHEDTPTEASSGTKEIAV